MQHSGFFNAIMSGGIPDRAYNANDYCDNLAFVIPNGVLRSDNDDLKVTASGMYVSVGVGKAWINGHYYYNDSDYNFVATLPPTGGSRYDRVMLRLNTDISERSISLIYVTGVQSNNPVKPAPIRAADIYDIVLADVYVGAGATSVVITDTRPDEDLCGWLYSNSRGFLFKRYTWESKLTSAASVVQFNIPQYDPETCFLEVYVNGILETESKDFELNGNIITFDGSLIAGTAVTVNVYKSIDSKGIESIGDEITELQNQFSTLDGVSKFTYKCSGLNDNASLSQIAQALYSGSYIASNVTPAAAAFLNALGGNAYLGSLSADAQVEISIVGKCGVGAPFAGNGQEVSRYRYFALGPIAHSQKKIIFDFAKCDKITITCNASTSNVILFGTDLYIKNINISAGSTAAACNIELIAGATNDGEIIIEDSYLQVSTTGVPLISENGYFDNCDCVVSSSASDAYCFDAQNTGCVRLTGGRYRAYCASAKSSAPFVIRGGNTSAVIMAFNINCPVVTNGALQQKTLAVANAGKVYINGVISTLTTAAVYASVSGQVPVNKVF